MFLMAPMKTKILYIKKTNNEDIISYIDLTNVTEDLMDKNKNGCRNYRKLY
jgi:ribosomal protein S11